jgi:hypothetical protein
LQDLPGVVVAAVVHHHHFELAVLLVHEHGDELLQGEALVAGADHHADGQFAVGFHLLLSERQAAEDEEVEEGEHHEGTGHDVQHQLIGRKGELHREGGRLQGAKLPGVTRQGGARPGQI